MASERKVRGKYSACTAAVLLIGMWAAPAVAREEVQRDFHKTVALPSAHLFRIENSNGNVTIHTHSKPEVEINASIHCSADTASEAQSFCDQIQIVVDEGTSLSVHTQYPSHWSSHSLSHVVHYDISMPQSSPLEVRNHFGAVTVTDLHAAGIIRNNNGHVTLSSTRSRQEVENSFGDVEVRGNDGDVTIRNGNGGVTATDITGALEITNRFGQVRVSRTGHGLTIRSNNGNIQVEHVTGAAVIGNSFGPVLVTDGKADVTVQNQNGEVRATDVAGTADLRTSFGSINFSHVGKALTARAQNAAIVGDTVGGAAVVETTFGRVELRDVKGGARVTAGK